MPATETRTNEDLDQIETYLRSIAERVADGESIGEAMDVTHAASKQIEKRAEAYLVGAQFKLERDGDTVGSKNANRIVATALAKVANDRPDLERLEKFEKLENDLVDNAVNAAKVAWKTGLGYAAGSNVDGREAYAVLVVTGKAAEQLRPMLDEIRNLARALDTKVEA